jgi:outer membrane protein OmpA-like peptidoglycan-associated protein
MRVWGLLVVWSCLAPGLLSGAGPAGAAAFGDCAPIGTLENFEASAPPQNWVFAAEAFRVLDGSDYKTIEKKGKTCLQHYSLKSGVPRTTDLEIMRNYTDGLPDLGFRITNLNRSPDDEIFATMTKGGVEFWAHVWASNGDGLHILVQQVAPFQPTLAPAVAAADCAPIRGLQEFAAENTPPETRTYAAENFRVFENGEAKSIEKSGKTCLQHYTLKPGVAHKTDLEIIENYALALPQEGWTITNGNRDEDSEIFATLAKDGTESWAHVWPSNGDAVHVLLLQIQPFRPSLAAAVTAVDCPPIRGLQEFAADGPPETRTYAAEGFRVIEDGAGKTIEKTGKTCQQHYALKPGVPHKTDLEIIKNYALALPQEGWTITNGNRDEDSDIFATSAKDGVESWVHVWPSNGDAVHVLWLQIEPFRPSLIPSTAQDCAPIRGLRDFAVGGPSEQKPFDSLDFRLIEDGQGKTITKTGKTCRQNYALKSGIAHKTDLEIIKNYAEALPQEGWTVTNSNRDEDSDIFATSTKDGVESWVHVWASNGDSVHVALLQIAPFKSSLKAAQSIDEPPAPAPPSAPRPPPSPPELTLPAPAATPEPVRAEQGDFPYLPSVPGSKLIQGRADPAPFYVQPEDAKQPELVANGSILKQYQPPPGLGLAPLLGLYHTSLLRAHWTIVSELHAAGVTLSAHYGENGRNIWATLHLAETAYSIAVADATIAQNRLAADLGSKCHLALTGVLFDFNKSTLKPESDAVLRQVAALMTQDPVLKLEIQGHTDNVGSDAYNQPLSEARAHSVVTWLNQHSIARPRLTARGYGKTRPIATNATDEGRAQNRRVEIANPACKM